MHSALRQQPPGGPKISCLKVLFNRINTPCSIPESKKNVGRNACKVFSTNGSAQQTLKHLNPCGTARNKNGGTVSAATASIFAFYVVNVVLYLTSTMRGQLMKPVTLLEAFEWSVLAYKITCKNYLANCIEETGNQTSWA